MARAGNSFAGRFALGWIPASAGMTFASSGWSAYNRAVGNDERKVIDFFFARGSGTRPQSVTPAEAGIQTGCPGAAFAVISIHRPPTVRRPPLDDRCSGAHLPVVERLTSARQGDVSRRTGSVYQRMSSNGVSHGWPGATRARRGVGSATSDQIVPPPGASGPCRPAQMPPS